MRRGRIRMGGMRILTGVAVVWLVFVPVALAQKWEIQSSRVDSSLRGVSGAWFGGVGGEKQPVVWASGSNGVVLRSVDEGKTWKRLAVAGGEKLDFRGVWAFDEKTAFLMSSGEAEKSRIYKTTDGGESWKLQYTDSRKEFFLDSLACLNRTTCYALGDPMDGRFVLLKTDDGGHWGRIALESLPKAVDGEGAFAASNRCLLLDGDEIYFASGGAVARVFHSADKGKSWEVFAAPLAQGPAGAGIFALAKSEKTIVIVGGNYQEAKAAHGVAAYSTDKGKTWKLAESQPGGYRSGVAAVDRTMLVAVGTNGTDASVDGGVHWKPTRALNLNAAGVLSEEYVWAVGAKGTIARLRK
jgi:photosystem II stability/assembly factor-like uncharacterized protein